MLDDIEPNFVFPRTGVITFSDAKSPRALQISRSTRLSVFANELGTGEEVVLQKADLLAQWKASTCRFSFYANFSDDIIAEAQKSIVIAEQALTEKKRKAVLTIFEEFESLRETMDRRGRTTRHDMEALSAKLREANPGVRGFSTSALYRKWKSYISANFHQGALFPKPASEEGASNKYDKVVLGIFNDALKYYLDRGRPSAKEVFLVFKKKIEEQNQTRDLEHRLRTPSKSTFRRWLKKLDPYMVTEARYGERVARANHGTYGKGEEATRPMQIVQADHTPIDLALLSDVNGLPCSRAYLTILVCVYSRCIVGFHISFDPPSYYSVARALQHAITPKDYIADMYPHVKNRWPCCGLIERLIVDNGAEFHSNDFERACALLNIRIEYTEKRKPHKKGIVERTIKTVNDTLQNMPGKRFGRAIDEPEYDADLHAYATITDLLEVLHRFFVDVYNQSPHAGINDIPTRRFVKGTELYPLLMPPSFNDLKAILGKRDERVLQPDGIEFRTIQYYCPEIAEIRNHPDYVPGTKVEFFYDPNDCSMIQVMHPAGRLLDVPAIKSAMLVGMSFGQFRLLANYARKELHRQADMAGIEAAMEDIRRKLGFYEKRKRNGGRRMSRSQTRLHSVVLRQEAPAEGLPTPVSRPRKVAQADSTNAFSHRQSDEPGWGTAGKEGVRK